MSASVSALQVCQPFGISRRTRSTAAARHAAGAVRPCHSSTQCARPAAHACVPLTHTHAALPPRGKRGREHSTHVAPHKAKRYAPTRVSQTFDDDVFLLVEVVAGGEVELRRTATCVRHKSCQDKLGNKPTCSWPPAPTPKYHPLDATGHFTAARRLSELAAPHLQLGNDLVGHAPLADSLCDPVAR